jgi:Ser/Thr protein kinase RdoA (MazF antagonist)
VFRVDDIVLRVSSADVDIAGQVALGNWLSDHGVPASCPIAGPLAVDGLAVTVWEYIDSHGQINYRQLGAAIALLHQLEPASVAEHVELPWCGDTSWLDLAGRLDAAARTEVVSDDDIAVLRAAADDLADWQDLARQENPVVCHGDVHPQNVLMRDDVLLILDWDSICLGPTAWDHAALLTWADRWGGDPDDYQAFAGGYGADLRDSPAAQRLARVRLLAPTINMVIKGASSARHANEARLRMRYWRGEPRPPAWTPQ